MYTDKISSESSQYWTLFYRLEGSREVLLIHPDDMKKTGLEQGQRVSLIGDADDGIDRRVDGDPVQYAARLHRRLLSRNEPACPTRPS
jgi:anaerobic selenocysteine-containing dehydrogenase